MGIFSLLLALAKAYPAFASQVEQVATEIRRQRLAATHVQIDAACDAAQAAAPVCPPDCPLRAFRLHGTGTAGATVPKAP
jgi:hypothetical protein